MFKDRIVRPLDKPVLSSMTSPVLFSLQDLISLRGQARVLNLGGSSQPETDSIFRGLTCDVESCNLFDRLKDEQPQKNESDSAFINRLRKLCRDTIPVPKENGFDLILCWDGLNYLPTEVLSFITRYIVNFVNPTTLFHMYFHVHSVMPQIPGKFKSDQESVQVFYPNDKTTESPAYTQSDIAKMMPRYTVVRSMLLKSGMQEYLMKLGPM